MIHAYLFITENNKDRDGHGPEFCKHMHRINAKAGTNITVSDIQLNCNCLLIDEVIIIADLSQFS